MNCRVKISFILFFLSAYFPFNVTAQSVTILSSGSEARICSIAAQSAAQFQFSSHDELESCTIALEHGNLKKRDRAGTYVNRGIVHTALEHYKDAFADYNSAIDLMAELPEAYVGRGNIYFLAKKYDLAIKDYTRALELNIDKDHIAHFNRGMAYEKLNEFSNAEENYRRALELVPDWLLAKNKLDHLLAKQHQ